MTKRICVALAMMFFGCTVVFAQDSKPVNPTQPLTIDSGKITGLLVGDNGQIAAYKGIPFAAPPVGELRWKPPQPAGKWDGVRKCTEFGPACPQPSNRQARDVGKQSEDCLYLNVWAPANAAGKKLPVMVWIHGGGCTTGAGSLPYYDGEKLAARGVVLVTINYRLGAFGYMAHPQLSKESANNVSGNYGLLDQVAALEWVKRNISAFGGDPDCVTIFGESAGSLSVCRLMVSPLAKGLFHRAIAQSGGVNGWNRLLRQDVGKQVSGENLGRQIEQKLGCDGQTDPLAAMRKKTADEILAVQDASVGLFSKGIKWGPVVDGWAIPDDPAKMFADGRQHDVPFMAGSNADEGTIFISNLPIKHVAGYKMMMRTLFVADTDEALKLFPAEKDEDVPVMLNKVTTVLSFVAPARFMADSMAKKKSKAYMYHFTRPAQGPRVEKLGAFHGLEIGYIFGNFGPSLATSDQDKALSAELMERWTNFARTGTPSFGGRDDWPAYDRKTDQYMELDVKCTVKSGLYKDACDLAEKYYSLRKDGKSTSQPSTDLFE